MSAGVKPPPPVSAGAVEWLSPPLVGARLWKFQS